MNETYKEGEERMMKVPFFELDGMSLNDTRALHIVTRPEVLGPHGAEEDTILHRDELLGRANEEAVRKSLPVPYEDHQELEAQARGYRGRAGKKIGPILDHGDPREEGRGTMFRDGRTSG